MRNYWWSESLGRLTLKLTMNDARNCSHSGSCNVEQLSQIPRIKKQTEKWDHETLKDSLREFSAWDDVVVELSNHEQNVRRMIWIACNDIVENDEEDEEN